MNPYQMGDQDLVVQSFDLVCRWVLGSDVKTVIKWPVKLSKSGNLENHCNKTKKWHCKV